MRSPLRARSPRTTALSRQAPAARNRRRLSASAPISRLARRASPPRRPCAAAESRRAHRPSSMPSSAPQSSSRARRAAAAFICRRRRRRRRNLSASRPRPGATGCRGVIWATRGWWRLDRDAARSGNECPWARPPRQEEGVRESVEGPGAAEPGLCLPGRGPGPAPCAFWPPCRRPPSWPQTAPPPLPPTPKSHHADAASACFASAQPCSYGRLPKCTGMCGGRQRQQLASAGRGDRRGGKVCDPESDGAGRGGRAFSPFMANSAILTLISNCRARAPRCEPRSRHASATRAGRGGTFPSRKGWASASWRTSGIDASLRKPTRPSPLSCPLSSLPHNRTLRHAGEHEPAEPARARACRPAPAMKPARRGDAAWGRMAGQGGNGTGRA